MQLVNEVRIGSYPKQPPIRVIYYQGPDYVDIVQGSDTIRVPFANVREMANILHIVADALHIPPDGEFRKEDPNQLRLFDEEGTEFPDG